MRNIFISFPFDEQRETKDKIIRELSNKDILIDYSEKEDKSNTTDENIWRNLLKRIKGSSITIVVHDDSLNNYKAKAKYDSSSYEKSKRLHNSGWIYKEIVASLRDWEENRINGIIYLIPDNYWQNFNWSHIPEIIAKNMNNHKRKENESYVTLVKEEFFFNNPEYYIEKTFNKRTKQIENKEYEIINNLHLN